MSGRRSADVVVYCTCTARGLGGVAGSSPAGRRPFAAVNAGQMLRVLDCLFVSKLRRVCDTFVLILRAELRRGKCSSVELFGYSNGGVDESRICVAACCVTDDEPARPLLAHIGGLPAVSAPLNIAVFQ